MFTGVLLRVLRETPLCAWAVHAETEAWMLSVAVFVLPMTVFVWRAWTSAPLTALPLLARETIPATAPSPSVKETPLLGTLFTVTTTGPLVAVAGTGATILVLLQLVGIAGVP